jgi:predicted nucleic acid-binding protein
VEDRAGHEERRRGDPVGLGRGGVTVTAEAARHWALLRARLAEEGRRAKVNDLWIAAVATANGMDVVSQDDDFDAIETVGGPTVIRV